MVDYSEGESEADSLTSLPSLAGRFALVLARKPAAFRSGAKEKWKLTVAGEARARWANPPLTGDLYARIVWFHREVRKGQDGDADNISKPIIDSLIGVVYHDDSQVVKRFVHKVDTLAAYDLSTKGGEPGDVAELERLLSESVPHIIYLEVGRFESKSISFGPIDEPSS